MSAVRNIFNDLVDRRLWPIAIALLAALVAVPVLLGGGSSAPAPAPAAPLASASAGTTAAAAHAAVSIAATPTTPQNRPGPVRNPFVQHKIPAPKVVTVPTTSAPVISAPVTSAPVTSGPTTPSVSGPNQPLAPIVPGRPSAPAPDVWRVNLRFGEAGNQKVHHDIPRLSPLPSATNPFFIFMGVLADHKTAVFLISSDATATGDGTCRPNKVQCDTIEMRAGDTEFFDVAQGDAGVTQYELDLLKVFHGKVSGTAAAAKAASRVSTDGKNVIHELKAEGQPTGMGRYIWSAKRGVLVRRHTLKVAAAAVSSSSSATDSAAHSSGVVGVTWNG